MTDLVDVLLLQKFPIRHETVVDKVMRFLWGSAGESTIMHVQRAPNTHNPCKGICESWFVSFRDVGWVHM